MSLNKSATSRLSLLTGSSLVAASLSALAFTAAAIAPTAAHAYDECVPGNPPTTQSDGAGGVSDVTLNGTTADTFVCAGTIPSITYPDTLGGLTLTLRGSLVTGGILATPDSTHAFTINRPTAGQEPSLNTGDPSIVNTSGAAIEVVRSVGSTINVGLTDNDTGDDPMVISGTTAGVRLRNTGTGATLFSFNRGTVSASNGAAIDVGTDGTGNFSITLGIETTVSGSAAALIISGGNNATFENSSASLTGTVQAGNAGNFLFNQRNRWTTAGTSYLGSGNTQLTNDTFQFGYHSIIETNVDGAPTTFDFGTGTDVFTNRHLIVGVGDEAAATFVVTGLESWNNTGLIVLGAAENLGGTDGVPNDRIVAATPTTFTGVIPTAAGSGDGGVRSTLLMDVAIGSGTQNSCAAAVVADCLDLRGSTTAGRTHVQLNAFIAGAPTLSPIVLVDVNGGVSADEHFVLDDASASWRRGGPEGVIEQGVFAYSLRYDADTQQHVLAPQPGAPLVALSQLGGAIGNVWEATTGSFLDRQADLRQTIEARGDEGAYGAWIKMVGSHAERTNYQSYELDGFDYEFNTGLTQDTRGFVGGIDLLNISNGDRTVVAGLTVGQVSSEVDFKDALGILEMDGYSLGSYLSALVGPFFVDAVLNSNQLDLEYEGPGVSGASAEADSLGMQTEVGYHLDVSENTFIEPLLAVAFVKSEVGDLQLSDDVVVGFDEVDSRRVALGLRYGGAVPFSAFTTTFAVTGRAWKEFDGENPAFLRDADPDFAGWSDHSEDVLGDVALTLGAISNDGRLSAFVDGGVRFMENYVATDASIGFRYGW